MENNYIGWDGTEAAANVGTMIVFEEDAEDNQLGGVTAQMKETHFVQIQQQMNM